MTCYRRSLLLPLVVAAALALTVLAHSAALAPSAARADGTWTPQTSGTSERLASVDFPNQTHGWAVGSNGTILATTDGGANWRAQWSGVTATLNSVCFPTSTNGWAVGESGTILMTADGGISWTLQQAGSDSYGLHSVFFVDKKHGWAVGEGGAVGYPWTHTIPLILGTKDGGENWAPQDLGDTVYRYMTGSSALESVFFLDSARGWAVGQVGNIFLTTDGGEHWQQSPWHLEQCKLNSVTFADDLHGWAVGTTPWYDGGYILSTADGGRSWTPRLESSVSRFVSVASTASSHICIVGQPRYPFPGNVVFSSGDGGSTWTSRTLDAVTPVLGAVTSADDYHSWAVGAGGNILAYRNTPPDPGEWHPALGKPIVVLLNGFHNDNPTRGDMAHLKALLETTKYRGYWYGDTVHLVPSRRSASQSTVIDSTGMLDEQVKRLANWMAAPDQQDLRNHPIIIIGHSFGGVIARGLVSAKPDSSVELSGLKDLGILDNIQCVVQLGSPNGGSRLAEVVDHPDMLDAESRLIIFAQKDLLFKSDTISSMLPETMAAWNSDHRIASVPIHRAVGLFLPTAMDEANVSWSQGVDLYKRELAPDFGPYSAYAALDKFSRVLRRKASDGLVTRDSVVSSDEWFGDGGGWLTYSDQSHASGVPGAELWLNKYESFWTGGIEKVPIRLLHTHLSVVPSGDANPVFQDILTTLENPRQRWNEASGTAMSSQTATRTSVVASGSEASEASGSLYLPPQDLRVTPDAQASIQLRTDGNPLHLAFASREAAPVLASIDPSGSAATTSADYQLDDGTYLTLVDVTPNAPGELSLLISLGSASGTVKATGEADSGPELFLDVTSELRAVGKPVRLEAHVASEGAVLTDATVEADVENDGVRTAVVMRDDGLSPDDVAGDGFFTGETVLSGAPGEWLAYAQATGSEFDRATYVDFAAGSSDWARFNGLVEEITQAGTDGTVSRWGIASPLDVSEPGAYTATCDVYDSSGTLVAQPSARAVLTAGDRMLTAWIDGSDLASIAPGALTVAAVRLSRDVGGRSLSVDTTVGPTTQVYGPDDFENFSLGLTPDFSTPTSSMTPTFRGVARYTPGYVSSVEYSLDGGSTWTAADATDGDFDQASEEYAITLAPGEGLWGLLVRSRTGDGQVLATGRWGASRFIVDATAPTALAGVSATPDLLDPSTIKLTWSAPEPPSDTTAIVGYGVSLDMAPAVKTFDTSFTLQLPDPAGHSIRVRAIDAAGNAGPYTSLSVGDSTPPTTTVARSDALWNSAAVTITLAATDNVGGSGMSGGSAKTEYKLDDDDWTTGTSVAVPAPSDHSWDGEHTVSYRSTDSAGNVEDVKSVTVKIDTTSPGGTFSLAGGDSTTSSATVSADSAVTDPHGPLEMRFSLDGGLNWTAWEAYAESKTITLPVGIGSKTVYAQYRDAAGNVAELSDAIELLDGIPPVTVATGADAFWHNAPVTVTLTPTDNEGGSGMTGGSAKTEYKLDDDAWTTGISVTVTAPTSHASDGSHTISYRSMDAAGNVEDAKTCTVKIDTISPAGSFTLAGGAAQTASTAVTGTSSVSEANGPLQMRFSTDVKATWSSWAAYAAVADLTLPPSAGSKIVYAQYRDAAGNVLDLSDAIELVPPPDVTDPTASATGVSPGAWLRSAALVMLSGTDEVGGSGVLSITYVLDGGLPQTVIGASVPVGVPLLPNAAHMLVYRATDVAGNSCTDKTLSFTTDSIGPVTAGKAASGRKGRAIALRYRLSDNLSPQATAVKLIVKTSRGKKVKSFSVGTKKTAAWYNANWKPKAKGTYRYYVYAKDLAGNAQSKVGSAKVVVR